MGKTYRNDSEDWKWRRHNGQNKKSHKSLGKKGADFYYENDESFERYKKKNKNNDLGRKDSGNPR